MLSYIRKLFRSRTVWFGAILTALSSVASFVPMVYSQLTFGQLEAFRDMFGAEAMALVGLIVIILRIVTTKPISER